MRKILGMGLVMGLLLAGCGSEKEGNPEVTGLGKSLSDGVLSVGMECDYAPYNWTTTEAKASEGALPIEGSVGYCEGYDVVIAKKIADNLGVELEIRKIGWDGLIPALQAGQIDAIIGGMSPTAKRKEVIDFTDSYFTSDINLNIIVSTSSNFSSGKSLSDFNGAKISTQLGTFHGDLLSQIEGVDEAKAFDNYNSLMNATLTGVIDGYIAEESVAREQVAASDGELVEIVLSDGGSGFTLTPDQNTSAIGIRKEDKAFLEALNKALSSISNEERVELMTRAEESAGE